ncbi:hypothetical protein VTN77DRAFT_7989 [Rasamsonia byssochlamydoides]|uniref:uncharacterized protein n=1 Tax=Rasamsonia byssochlamydoides TaxID=89139 RepID=UPI003743F273
MDRWAKASAALVASRQCFVQRLLFAADVASSPRRGPSLPHRYYHSSCTEYAFVTSLYEVLAIISSFRPTLLEIPWCRSLFSVAPEQRQANCLARLGLSSPRAVDPGNEPITWLERLDKCFVWSTPYFHFFRPQQSTTNERVDAENREPSQPH